MLTTFLLVVHTLIAILLVGVILLQKSEGGGLGIGGGTGGGLMTARGAANLLTRLTTIFGGLFILTSILLAVLAAGTSGPRKVDTSLARKPAPVSAPAAPIDTPANGPGALPGLSPATTPATPAPATTPAPADSGVPIAR